MFSLYRTHVADNSFLVEVYISCINIRIITIILCFHSFFLFSFWFVPFPLNSSSTLLHILFSDSDINFVVVGAVLYTIVSWNNLRHYCHLLAILFLIYPIYIHRHYHHSHMYYRTHDTLWATAFVAQLAERRTRFAGSWVDSHRRPWSCIFRNWSAFTH